MPPARPRRAVVRVTPLGLFAAGFLFLCGAAGAVAAGQIAAKALGPVLSIGYSLGAVVCTVAAVVRGRRGG